MNLFRTFPLLALPLLMGCGASHSTGIMTGGTGATLPEGLPKRIVVLPFEGDATVTNLARERFMAELPSMGFTLVQGADVANDPAAMKALGKTGVDGVFRGTIKTITHRNRVTTEVNAELIRALSGSLVWQGSAVDPRRFSRDMQPYNSAARSVARLVGMLKSDLEKLAQAQATAAHAAARDSLRQSSRLTP